MKKNLIFFMGALLAISLVSCDRQPPEESTEITSVFTETAEITTTVTEETTAETTVETTAEITVETTAVTTAQTTAASTEHVTVPVTPPETVEVTQTNEPPITSEPAVFDYETSDLSEYIVLGKYLGIKVNVDSLPPLTEAQINTELELFMESVVYDAAILEGECKLGDKVNIDYYGTIDGEEFYGSSGDGYSLTLGNNEYIVNVDDGIVGMTVGETREITAAFPSDYGNAAYNGKTAVFEITLNYIYPPLTDELVAEYTDCATVEEFKNEIRNESYSEYRVLLSDAALNKAMANSYIVGLPEEEVNARFEDTVGINKLLAHMLNVSYEDYLLGAYGIGVAEAEEIFMDSAKNEVAQRLLIYAIARDMNMDISRSACESYILEVMGYESMEALMNNSDITEEQLDNLSYSVIREKVVSKIVSQAEFISHL